MAGNLTGDNNGNILVEFDYNNIIVVDPNKTIKNGKTYERLVDHENLVMFANLEAELLPRTKLSVGGSPEDRNRTLSIAKMNFLRPTERGNLTTGYLDEITGKNAINGLGDNQLQDEVINPKDGTEPYHKISLVDPGQTATDNGLLGITSISVRTSTSFIPSVSMTLEDVQGRALFQLGNNSPYSAFFNLPYPPFYLTLKGYYGQAIRLQLNLLKFNARFNTYSGNYQIELEFVGYKFNILNEISMAHLLAAPHMYSTTFDVSKSVTSPETQNPRTPESATNAASNNSTISQDNVVEQFVTEKGYQKVIEVYSEYKAKGLIKPTFPEITFSQLMNKLENFEKNIIESYTKVDVEPLTNIRRYKESLANYYKTIRGGQKSWFNLYLNPRPIILKGTGEKLYAFKDEILKDPTRREYTKSLLNKYIIGYNQLLSDNPTLGVAGPAPIKNTISYDTMIKSVVLTDVDLVATTTSQTGIIAPNEVEKLEVQKYLERVFAAIRIKDLFDEQTIFGDIFIPPLFTFEGNGKDGREPRFDYLISQIEAQANKKLSEYETAITAEFARKVEDSSTGIGFKPTVRNICAVIMASTEAFIRLLDDVHTNAWNVKYDPVRQLPIYNNPSSVKGTDTIDYLPVDPKAIANNSNYANAQQPVYPWPQFFVETPEDKKGRFQLKYIADPSVVNLTQGYLYDKWPEVEFVEEYMKALTQKFNPPAAQPPNSSDITTNIINMNAIEYPSEGIAYLNKEELKFFYEIWERQFLTANYSGFIRANDNQLYQIIDMAVSAETNNIVTSLGVSSPFLTSKLKNYKLTANNYVSTLKNFSNQGTGASYQELIRDFYVTPYLKTLTENSFNILSINDIGKEPQTSTKSTALNQLVSNAPNDPIIFDTYPFTDPTWVSNNMALSALNTGNEVYNTTKSLKVFQQRNVISNFETIYDYKQNRPVTNFSFNKVVNPTTEIQTLGLTSFLNLRKNTLNFIPTEGFVNYNSPSQQVTIETTSSILNTPYFINAIQNGVSGWKNGDKYPYIQASYLFINSLPLASLRERYRTDNSTTSNVGGANLNPNIGGNDLDYIASCFKKFGAIHKMPYAWVLKMGSIWYRYKTFKTTGVDMLASAWKNFNYKENFDPIASSDTKTYTFNFEGIKNITLQRVTNDDTKIQTGFYPKVINDFNLFYNGYSLYSGYTDSEIQASINGGVKVYNFADSNITISFPDLSSIQTWSVVLPNGVADTTNNSSDCSPNNNTTSISYYVVPSFGTQFNQVNSECFEFGLPICQFVNNQSMFNGTVRMLWDAPNYGYFDNTQISMPSPDRYLNKIVTTDTEQAPFKILLSNDYSSIEEIFSVFDKSILDKFEQEFLNFSKPVSDIDLGPQVEVPINTSPANGNATFRNFQYLFRSLMKINAKNETTSNAEFFNNVGGTQLINFTSTIKAFFEYDVILKYGNPANYKKRIFDSFISDKGGVSTIVDPITFSPYVKGTLPSAGGKTTLAQSKANYPAEWLTLETEVGFSTIENLIYTDEGSFITDFFINNDIGFTVNNITLCAPLVKIYATQKTYIPTLTTSQFVTKLQNYFDTTTNLQNSILNQVLTNLNLLLPNQQQLPERAIQSVIDGQQSKVENYEVFKALNDKWIAGGDFKNKTLFEDILFLDRASRNIGDTIIVDIFDLKNLLKKSSLNMGMSVFTFMSGILIKNKFNVMPLPAYVNFYNVQDADGTTTNQSEGSLQFADNMWGTFLNVDYRKSGPKLLCFYAGLPSGHLQLPKGNSRFRDDAFELRRASENPLIENQVGKKDWGISNKCVGFNVDIGIRNQNIFSSFNIGMESGKATSESLQTQLDITNQANGRNVATQNVSLYNLYKNRSYTCQVVCLGNALLQPMMYFNLRHVPMFNGPYLITDVSHIITPGQFQTTFGGIRQGIYDLPSIDNLLQSLNTNVLTKIEAVIKNSKDPVVTSGATDIDKTAILQQLGNNTAAAENSCTLSLVEPYTTWGNFVKSQTTQLTPKQLVDALKAKNIDANLQLIIYCICYITNFRENVFYGYNNNFANITLTTDFGDSTKYFIQKQSSCVNIGGSLKEPTPKPIANFESLSIFLDFMIARISPRVNQIVYGDSNGVPLGLEKYYTCFWPVSNVSVSYFDAHWPAEYTQLTQTLRNAENSAGGDGQLDLTAVGQLKNSSKKQDINIQIIKNPSQQTNNLNNTPAPSPTCPPPVVTSFSPTIGIQNTILTILGTHLDNVISVTINGVVTTAILSNTSTSVTVSVPFSNTTVIQNNPIIVKTKNGQVTSTTNFTYDPNQVLPGTPAQPTNPYSSSNNNTQPQQTGSATLVSNVQGNTFQVKLNNNVGDWYLFRYPEYLCKLTKLDGTVSLQTNSAVQLTTDVYVTPNNTTAIQDRNFTITEKEFVGNVLGLTPIETIGPNANQDVNVTWTVKAVWANKVNNVPNTSGVPYPADVVQSFKWQFTLPKLP